MRRLYSRSLSSQSYSYHFQTEKLRYQQAEARSFCPEIFASADVRPSVNQHIRLSSLAQNKQRDPRPEAKAGGGEGETEDARLTTEADSWRFGYPLAPYMEIALYLFSLTLALYLYHQ